MGKEYESRQSIDEYLNTQREVIKKLVGLLSDQGSVCWQVGNYIHKKEVFPLDIYYYRIFKDLDLKLRNRIVWHFGHGLHASTRFSGRYETILWFTKGDEYIFNLDSVRVRSKYPGKRHFKGARKGEISGNPLGKNPSDVWEIVRQDWESELWNIPNVKANHPEKTEHPCQYPIELVSRCILALTNERSWVLDPYAGVGSTVLSALLNNRNVVGIEREKRYLETTRKRVAEFEKGTLKHRLIGKPIHTPSPHDKVAQYPLEWMKNG
jgi:DNA modification methylase